MTKGINQKRENHFSWWLPTYVSLLVMSISILIMFNIDELTARSMMNDDGLVQILTVIILNACWIFCLQRALRKIPPAFKWGQLSYLFLIYAMREMDFHRLFTEENVGNWQLFTEPVPLHEKIIGGFVLLLTAVVMTHFIWSNFRYFWKALKARQSWAVHVIIWAFLMFISQLLDQSKWHGDFAEVALEENMELGAAILIFTVLLKYPLNLSDHSQSHNEHSNMPLLKKFEIVGNYLFRWRSYLPLSLVVLFLSALPYYCYPLGSHLLDELWEILCLVISFWGLLIRIITVGYTPKRTSGRNTKKGQAADYLNIKGMYSIVRNPLYLGNFFIGLGISLFLRVWWAAFIYALLFVIYYERIIIAEEAFLAKKFKQQYIEWVSVTPAFFPKISQWQTPDLPFSFKKAIRKEYHGFLGIILSMFILEVASDLYLRRYFKFDFMWKCIVGFGAIVYVIIRFLHKKTLSLKTPGR